MSWQEWQAKSVFCDNAPNRIKVFVAGWKGKQIADCGVETPDTKADAQLLASAPELLAALEAWPRLPGLPPCPMALTLRTPLVMVVTPV